MNKISNFIKGFICWIILFVLVVIAIKGYFDSVAESRMNNYVDFDGTSYSEVCDEDNNCYTLDVRFTGGEATRLIFPKGGHLDIDYCIGNKCTDLEGNEWTIRVLES